MPSIPRYAFVLVIAWVCLCYAPITRAEEASKEVNRELKFESVSLPAEGDKPPATIHLLYGPTKIERRPVILMLGALDAAKPPDWATGLLDDGYMLAAFAVDHLPDPDAARRPLWLYFDQRFAHFYVQMGERVPQDAGRMIDHLSTRADVDPEKFGWMGSSTTGIPGLAVAVREPRVKAVVVFVSTGAYEKWINTWRSNGLWRGDEADWWPETKELFAHDPIRHVEKMYPTAVLMVNGGNDKVIDVSSARAFADAARPFYERDPARLRLVVYEGMSHNLPIDVVKMYAEHWFRLYLPANGTVPQVATAARDLQESAERTEINGASHKAIVESADDKKAE